MPLIEEGKQGLSLVALLKNKTFWIMFVMMACAGASEQSVSQWASTFAEQGLNISKTFGDLLGPMMFAVFMGLSRTIYGKFGKKININRFIIFSGILCIIAYVGVAKSPWPFMSLFFCALTGFSVGIMWPGTFSKSSQHIPLGGTIMFALLALAGDLGCSFGPTVVGFVSSANSDNLHIGILVATVFPILFLIAALLLFKKKSSATSPRSNVAEPVLNG